MSANPKFNAAPSGQTAPLLTPIALRGPTARNRIVVSRAAADTPVQSAE